jgi:ABC-type multidrug transport system fused ATPase/permease subunit
MIIPFWSSEPKILIDPEYLSECWPTKHMQPDQKLNALSRLIIALTIVGFIFTQSVKIVMIGATTLLLIFLLYRYKKSKNHSIKEMFQAYDKDEYNASAKVTSKANTKLRNPETLETFVKTDFEKTEKSNPFSNVLLTDINDTPERKAAPPSFNPEIHENITLSVKEMVQELNPGIKDTDKQLFGDLGEKFYLDQSNRQFFSTANTRVTNDQGAFGEFLYGNMYSAKEDGVEGAIARVQDNYRYTLY